MFASVNREKRLADTNERQRAGHTGSGESDSPTDAGREAVERRTRKGRRSLGCYRHAVLVLRWFLDGTRVAQLAIGNQLGLSTAYCCLHEAIDVLAAAAPACTVRCWPPGSPDTSMARWSAPTGRRRPARPRGWNLWWSGRHHHHEGNIQVVTVPNGWPLWTSPVRPGREHDTTCARTHPGLLDALTDWADTEHVCLPIWDTRARTIG